MFYDAVLPFHAGSPVRSGAGSPAQPGIRVSAGAEPARVLPGAATIPSATAIVTRDKPAYPRAAVTPTQAGPLGIRFDFNFGARVLLPEGHWRVRLSDIDTGNVLFESENRGAFVASSKRWFVRFHLQISDLGPGAACAPVFAHDCDAGGRELLIHSPVGTLGDGLAWFPFAARFARKRGCRPASAMSNLLIPLLRDAHPDITFLTTRGPLRPQGLLLVPAPQGHPAALRVHAPGHARARFPHHRTRPRLRDRTTAGFRNIKHAGST